jgi:hypothetical protein
MVARDILQQWTKMATDVDLDLASKGPGVRHGRLEILKSSKVSLYYAQHPYM